MCCVSVQQVSAYCYYRDQNFRVSKVTSQDVIHAGPKLIPAIFKVGYNSPVNMLHCIWYTYCY